MTSAKIRASRSSCQHCTRATEMGQKTRVMGELTARVVTLAKLARDAGMGFNIDAEEADRLDLSLDVIEAVLRDDALAGWDGFGVVVQAYGKRAAHMLDWLHALATELDRRIMVRLVKGAYWDTEIKRAQVEGLNGFPVFSRKVATDVSYLCCAAKLLAMTDRIYPQFATHNAHTVAAILELATDKTTFEFQRLHGMGETLHDLVLQGEGTRCRIYAPVGAHRDLLAYLVRRLLENGANSSFVNQIVDENVPAEDVAEDPFDALAAYGDDAPAAVAMPAAIFGARANSKGWDLRDVVDLAEIETARAPFMDARWEAGPLLAVEAEGGEVVTVLNPANHKDVVGRITLTGEAEIDAALAAATDWSEAGAAERATALRKAADLYEAHFGELFALLTREAGKAQTDAIGEMREAVDFLRFYADEAERLRHAPARGLITCISPWNFPLAIFTGQIAAALAAGNGVLAKPAEATGLVAHGAVELLHEAGVPRKVLQLLPGHGAGCGRQTVGRSAHCGRLLYRLDGNRAADQPGHGGQSGAFGPADRGNRRAERDGGGQHSTARAGHPRYHHRRVSIGWPALFGAQGSVPAGGHRRAVSGHALRRNGRAGDRQPLGVLHRYRSGDRCDSQTQDRGAYRGGAGRGAGSEGAEGADGGDICFTHRTEGWRHRRSGRGDLWPGAACGDICRG